MNTGPSYLENIVSPFIEEGSHQTLLRKGGVYAQLWSKQSGGFLDPAAVA